MAMGTRDFAQHPSVGHIISNRYSITNYYKCDVQNPQNGTFTNSWEMLPTPGKCLRVGNAGNDITKV